jgi:Tfp pilus assembly protein PilF
MNAAFGVPSPQEGVRYNADHGSDHMQDPLDAAWELLGRGELGEAEKRCRGVLAASKNRNVQAWIMLGTVLREQRKQDDAEAAFRRAISMAPRDVYAHHNLGALLSAQDRPEEALAALNRAQALALNAPELHVNRGRALMQLYRLDDAEKAYARAAALEPRDPTAQTMLAQLRFMRGDPDFARDLVAVCDANPGNAGLQLTLAEMRRRANDLAGAEGTLRSLRDRVGAFPEVSSALARVLLDAGRLAEAMAEALQGLQMRPANSAIADIAASTLLSGGRPDQALALIRQHRLRTPEDQRWIAYEATAARVLNQPLYRQLYDYSRFVRVYDIETPRGWTDMTTFNAALEAALRSRHVFKTHPLDQSLRNGSQTARNLMTDKDKVVQTLLGAFSAPLADYVRSVEAESNHPLSSQGRGAVGLKGCWSVDLHGRGYHVNHVHPEGWISSAYYVKTPESATDSEHKHGWIKFGESPLPLPSVTPQHFIQPRPGRLVLFPSYMWHGTQPVLDEDQRLTVAFDAVAPKLSR